MNYLLVGGPYAGRYIAIEENYGTPHSYRLARAPKGSFVFHPQTLETIIEPDVEEYRFNREHLRLATNEIILEAYVHESIINNRGEVRRAMLAGFISACIASIATGELEIG